MEDIELAVMTMLTFSISAAVPPTDSIPRRSCDVLRISG